MKRTSKLLAFLLTLLALTASAYAQSPREQLQQLVDQLQKTPGDNALREKIIQLAPSLKPSPAVPDTAVAFEGRAQFAFRSAKSENDFLVAAQEYEKAVAAAPWVPGYYSDLCTIYEKAGRFEDAKRHCGFYLMGLTDTAQMTDVKRRIAGLEFGIEKAAEAAKGKSVADAAAEKERLRPSVEGKWGDGFTDFQIIKSGEKFIFIMGTFMAKGLNVSATVIEVNQQRVRFDVNIVGNRPDQVNSFALLLSVSGNELTGTMRNNLGTNPMKFTKIP